MTRLTFPWVSLDLLCFCFVFLLFVTIRTLFNSSIQKMNRKLTKEEIKLMRKVLRVNKIPFLSIKGNKILYKGMITSYDTFFIYTFLPHILDELCAHYGLSLSNYLYLFNKLMNPSAFEEYSHTLFKILICYANCYRNLPVNTDDLGSFLHEDYKSYLGSTYNTIHRNCELLIKQKMMSAIKEKQIKAQTEALLV